MKTLGDLWHAVDQGDMHQPVLVLDEDGFFSRIDDVVWDDEHDCYIIKTKYLEA